MTVKDKIEIKGFTLAETVIVIGIVAIVGVTLGQMIAYFYATNRSLLQETSTLDSAHRGLDTSFRALRQASYGVDGSYPVSAAATSSVTFYTDIDHDNVVERVHLYVANGKFIQGATEPFGTPPNYSRRPEVPSTLATGVVNAPTTPVFRYYDAAGVELLPPINAASVRSVLTQVEIDQDTARGPGIFTLRSSATLRSLLSQ